MQRDGIPDALDRSLGEGIGKPVSLLGPDEVSGDISAVDLEALVGISGAVFGPTPCRGEYSLSPRLRGSVLGW